MTFPRYESSITGIENFRPLGEYTFEGWWPDIWAKEKAKPPKDSYVDVPHSNRRLNASDLMWFIDGVPWFVWLWSSGMGDTVGDEPASDWDPIGDSMSTYLDMGEFEDASPLARDGYLDKRVVLDRGAVLFFPEPVERGLMLEKSNCANIGCMSDGAPSIGLEF